MAAWRRCILLSALLIGWALQAPAQEATPGLRLWWNDPGVVEVLALDTATRSAMDAVHRRLAVDGSAAAIRGSRGGFKGALIRRDWEDAEFELQGIARPTLNEGRLKIEVLQLLSPEQHATLVERMPTVFRRKWKPSKAWAVDPPRKPDPKDAASELPKPDVEGLE